MCSVVWRLFVIEKIASTFDGLSKQGTIGQHFPMNCSKIGHSFKAFTYLFGQCIFICLHAAHKNSLADLWKFSSYKKICINLYFWWLILIILSIDIFSNLDISSKTVFQHLSVESRICKNFLVTAKLWKIWRRQRRIYGL